VVARLRPRTATGHEHHIPDGDRLAASGAQALSPDFPQTRAHRVPAPVALDANVMRNNHVMAAVLAARRVSCPGVLDGLAAGTAEQLRFPRRGLSAGGRVAGCGRDDLVAQGAYAACGAGAQQRESPLGRGRVRGLWTQWHHIRFIVQPA
jgi:hypothetical protein